MRIRHAAAVAATLCAAAHAEPALAQAFTDPDERGPSLERVAIPLDFERPWGRGPLPIRDSMPLAAMRLALHPFSPETAAVGEPVGRVEVTWGNTFLDHDSATVDAEVARAAIEIRDGVTDYVDAGIEIPLVYRGGGVLDGVANFMHDAFSFPDGGRSAAPDDRYLIAVEKKSGALSEPDEDWGLGDVIVSSKANLADGSDGSGFGIAILGETRIPTANDDLGADGFDVGVTGAISTRPIDGFVVYGGLGGTWFPDDRHQGLRYEPLRGYGFLAVEWEALEWASLLLQGDVASPLLDGPDSIDGWQSYVHMGAAIDVTEELRLELAFVENLEDQDATADFALFAALGFRF
jgi:hypothetical protein